MTLDEIIALKLKTLYDEIDRLTKENTSLNYEIDELTEVLLISEDFIHTMADNWANISLLDTKSMTDYLIKYGLYAYDKSEVEETFRIINIVYDAIKDGINTSLTDEQKAFIEGYIGNLIQMIKTINENIELKDKELKNNKNKTNEYDDLILNLEYLKEKISDALNEEILNEDDFHAFYSIVEDSSISNEIKKQAIIKFIKYNTDRLSNTPKNISRVSIDDIKDLFSSYGFNDLRSLKVIEKNKSELELRGNLQNINSILGFMNENKILNKFPLSVILSICIIGDYESVVQTYKKLSDENRLTDLYFQTPGVWINNPVKRKNGNKRIHRNPNLKDGPCSLYYSARRISLEDIDLNIKFLKEKGFDINLANGDKNMKLLTTPNYKIVSNYNICRKYGLYDGKVKNQVLTPLYGSNIEERLDNLVELGLLNGKNLSQSIYGDYVLRYPSSIVTIDQNHIMYLYYLRSMYDDKEYYSRIFSKSRIGMLTKENIPSFDSEEKTQKFNETNFVSFDDIPNFDIYNSLINENNEEYNEEVFHEKEIFDLERQFRVRDNDFVYYINGIIISRLKVLKVCSILRHNGIKIGKEEIMYALTKGMKLTKKSYNKIASSIGYNMEEIKNGLL